MISLYFGVVLNFDQFYVYLVDVWLWPCPLSYKYDTGCCWSQFNRLCGNPLVQSTWNSISFTKVNKKASGCKLDVLSWWQICKSLMQTREHLCQKPEKDFSVVNFLFQFVFSWSNKCRFWKVLVAAVSVQDSYFPIKI